MLRTGKVKVRRVVHDETRIAACRGRQRVSKCESE